MVNRHRCKWTEAEDAEILRLLGRMTPDLIGHALEAKLGRTAGAVATRARLLGLGVDARDGMRKVVAKPVAGQVWRKCLGCQTRFRSVDRRKNWMCGRCVRQG
jgi:hypothetical protein